MPRCKILLVLHVDFQIRLFREDVLRNLKSLIVVVEGGLIISLIIFAVVINHFVSSFST